MVENQECERYERRPCQCHMLEAQMGFSQKRRNVGYTYGKKGWGKNDWIQLWRVGPPRKTDVIPLLLKMIHLASLQMKKDGGIPLKKGKRR